MDLANLPFPFFISILALLLFSLVAWNHRNESWGLPMGMVLGTVAVWYQGDALYNDYEKYRLIVGDEALTAGWWQVTLFIVSLGLMVPPMHRMINDRFRGRPSQFVRYVTTRRLEHPSIQRKIDLLGRAMVLAWLLLMSVALLRVKFDFFGLFAPYLTDKAHPWARGRMGGGIDAILSLAGYVQILLTAAFGVLAAVARNPRTRGIAITVCFLSFPYYIFDRTRNTMLATMLPGLLAWVLFRVKGGLLVQGAILGIAFLIVNFWFSFVIANRNDGSIAKAFRSSDGIEQTEEVKHGGISMFSELGYMNSFFALGTYTPNWGARYFAELVNPIPRALWPGKPTVGIDYAIARGFGKADVTDANAGVAASIATGMIGQGIVNFGRFLGPVAAAFLMSIWVSILARQDLMGADPARLLLYAIGMILTFNMGRDITLLVLYPYVFGWLLVRVREYYLGSMSS
jgi:hypothetical protein